MSNTPNDRARELRLLAKRFGTNQEKFGDHAEAEAALLEYARLLTAATEPQRDMVQVPREPTQEMLLNAWLEAGLNIDNDSALKTAYAAMLAVAEEDDGTAGSGRESWVMELAKEIRANAEDHPNDYISKFALQWADQLAARYIAQAASPAGEERKAVAWQPIETAPMDDTMFLAGWIDGRMCVMKGSILHAQKTRKHPTPEHLQFQCTHWMPLPSVPNSTDQVNIGGEKAKPAHQSEHAAVVAYLDAVEASGQEGRTAAFRALIHAAAQVAALSGELAATVEPPKHVHKSCSNCGFAMKQSYSTGTLLKRWCCFLCAQWKPIDTPKT